MKCGPMASGSAHRGARVREDSSVASVNASRHRRADLQIAVSAIFRARPIINLCQTLGYGFQCPPGRRMELADNRWVMSTRFVLFSSEGMDCFVIMPIGDPSVDQAHFDKMENIYSEWIKPTVESIQRSDSPGSFLRCHRADKEVGPGDIVEHVIESLINSRIVIVDLTGKTANVFYELGVRHAVSNSTILLAEGTEHIPFDLRTLRAIVYQYTPPGMVRVRRQLQEAVMSIVTAPDKIDNPVRRIL